MKKLSKNTMITLTIIFALVQSLFIYKTNEENKSKVCIDQSNIKSYKNLSQFNQELDCLAEKSIIAANQVDGKWHIRLKIQGNKEYILNELSKLKAYDISDYVINHNSYENTVIIEITDSERA